MDARESGSPLSAFARLGYRGTGAHLASCLYAQLFHAASATITEVQAQLADNLPLTQEVRLFQSKIFQGRNQHLDDGFLRAEVQAMVTKSTVEAAARLHMSTGHIRNQRGIVQAIIGPIRTTPATYCSASTSSQRRAR